MKAKSLALIGLICALCLLLGACSSTSAQTEEPAEEDEATELSEEEHANDLASPLDAQGNPIDFTITQVNIDKGSVNFQVQPVEEDGVLYLYVNSITVGDTEYFAGKSKGAVTFTVDGEEESSWSMRMQKGSACTVDIAFEDAGLPLDQVTLNCDETLAKKNGNTFTETNAYSDFDITVK